MNRRGFLRGLAAAPVAIAAATVGIGASPAVPTMTTGRLRPDLALNALRAGIISQAEAVRLFTRDVDIIRGMRLQ